MSDLVTKVSDHSFDAEVLEAATPVLVDFWAEWCGPCRMLAPTVDRLAEEFEGRMKVVKVNVDDSAATSSRYGIKSIPTLVLFKNGSERERVIGNQSHDAIKKMLARHVG